MIQPIHAIAGSTRVANPYATNPVQSYKNATNYSQRGEKLNIDCNEMRTLIRDGKKIDYYA